MKDLKGKTAYVSGAASGIGFGIASALAQAGASIAMVDIRADALAEARARLHNLGAHVETFVSDVSDAALLEETARAIDAAFGPIHIVCNNAGVSMLGVRLEEIPRVGLGLGHRRQHQGRHQRHSYLRAAHAPPRRGRTHRQHRLDRRAAGQSEFQDRRLCDDQIRGRRALRSARAGTRGQRHRRLGAVPGRGRHRHSPLVPRRVRSGSAVRSPAAPTISWAI